MSTILCYISVKQLAFLLMTVAVIVWTTATKYAEAKQKQRERENAHKIAIATTAIIFAGQLSWWAIKKLRQRILYEMRVRREMELKPSPRARAAAVASSTAMSWLCPSSLHRQMW